MLKIIFNSLDYLQLLKNIGKLPEGINMNAEENEICLLGSKESFESIIDILSNNLAESGVDENDNINSIGLTIERLIDIISNKLWD